MLHIFSTHDEKYFYPPQLVYVLLLVAFASCKAGVSKDSSKTSNVTHTTTHRSKDNSSFNARAASGTMSNSTNRKAAPCELPLTITNNGKEKINITLSAEAKDAKDSNGNPVAVGISCRNEQGGSSIGKQGIEYPFELSSNAQETVMLAPDVISKVQSCTIVVALRDQANNKLGRKELTWTASQKNNPVVHMDIESVSQDPPKIKFAKGDLTFEVMNVLAFYDANEGWKTGFKLKVENHTQSLIDLSNVTVKTEASPLAISISNLLEEGTEDYTVPQKPLLKDPDITLKNIFFTKLTAKQGDTILAIVEQKDIVLLTQEPTKENISLNIPGNATRIPNEEKIRCLFEIKSNVNESIDLDGVTVELQLQGEDQSTKFNIKQTILGQRRTYSRGYKVPQLGVSPVLTVKLLDKKGNELFNKKKSLTVIDSDKSEDSVK